MGFAQRVPRITTVVLGITIALSVGNAGDLAARQAPTDTAGVLLNLAADLANEGSAPEAEALYRLVLERYPNSLAANQARARLDELRQSRRAQEGRTELIAWSTIYGAFLGVALPAAFGAEGSEPYGLGLLLGAPTGYAVSRAYSARNGMTSGRARAMTFGTWWGTLQGLGWQAVFDIGRRTFQSCFDTGFGVVCDEFQESSDRAPFTLMVVGGLAGLTAGTVIGRHADVTASSALVTNFAALWGSGYGAAAAVIAGAEDEPVLASSLIGGNIGLLAGALGGSRLNLTTGQAWRVHLAGLAGALAGLGIDLIIQPDDPAAAVLIPTIGSAIGLALGFSSVRLEQADAEPSAFQASALHWDGTRLRAATPMPVPTALRVLNEDGTRVVPGVRLSLFTARF